MQTLIRQELDTNNKIQKPDFSTKTGREFLAFYLQTKFKQIISYDRKSNSPIFVEIKPDFISRFTRRIINFPEKRILVSICGESASGKTTICERIKKSINRFNMPVQILSSDNYFNDISELINIYGNFDNLLESGYDVDSPDNFQIDLLKTDLVKLSEGQDVYIPEYLINGSGRSVSNATKTESKKIIVVEGMASMYGDVPEVMDVKVYVDIDRATQKKWFLYRAQTRNQDQQNALKQLEYVRGASQKYIIPQRNKADIVINGAASLDYFEQILEYIHTITNCFEC